MTDMTLEDLASVGGEAADAASTAADAAEKAETAKDLGENLADIANLLDQRGLLEPILFGPEQAQEIQQQPSQPAGDQSGGGDVAGDLDAAVIADVGKQVIDQFGDVPVSKIVQLCEQRPSMVNKLIQQRAGEFTGDGGGSDE